MSPASRVTHIAESSLPSSPARAAAGIAVLIIEGNGTSFYLLSEVRFRLHTAQNLADPYGRSWYRTVPKERLDSHELL